MTFRKKNTLWGWLIFILALSVYILTLEPTMSLWDCGEFLVATTRLEIPHAPGAPLFMLIGRIFSLLSLGQPDRQAVMVNLVSALSGAGTVMLLFWTSVWLMRKIVSNKPRTVWLASGVGALSFAFTDSFWFSAEEAEVYALSSLLMALVLWAATRWEEEADEAGANRWILLIFFLTGLSIGVHLLNLLVIPTIALLIWFRRYHFSWKWFALVLGGSLSLILLIMSVYIPGLFSLAGPLELFAVNTLHLPFNSGFYLYLLLLLVAFVWALWYTQRHCQNVLNMVVLCLFLLTLGYTSYFTVFIRSAANPPVDQGNPETTFELINYLKRENYGTRPVLYGENYASVPREYKDRTSYVAEDDHYVPVRLNPEVEYEPETIGFFPRMHSTDENHREAYANWVRLAGKKVSYRNEQGRREQTVIPTLGENLQFFFRYQFIHMYCRYFLWNFVGKQDDVQGFGGPLHGNWESGIAFIDEARLGTQQNLPDEQQQNKGRNHYFFLPLLLGLTGLVFHYKKEQKTFGALALLFTVMSIGLVVYLNEVPETPRERDYVYVGSFYVFAIWIGLGALSVAEFVQRKMKGLLAAGFVGVLVLGAGPGILLQQNYDDHDRSGRYSGRDLAKNYLMSCEPNAILFTHADNDTYPLWYCQEVEGIRRDVRVVVMPYLNAGWYLRQLNRTIYANKGLRLTVPLVKYETGKVDYVPVVPRIKTEAGMQQVLDFVANDSSLTKIDLQNGEQVDFIPLTKIKLALGNDSLAINLNKKYILRNELAFWDIISSNIGDRPVYFTSWTDPRDYGLKDHLRFDGVVYKLVSTDTPSESVADMGGIDASILYDKLMNRCNWDNLADESVYFDWHHRRMFAVMNIRAAFYRLTDALIAEGDSVRALKAIQKSEVVLPFRLWPVDYWSCMANVQYFKIDEKEAGVKRLNEQISQLEQWLNYFCQFSDDRQAAVGEDLRTKLYLYRELLELALQNDPETGRQMEGRFQKYLDAFSLHN